MDCKYKTERKQQWYKILLRVKYFLMLLSFSRPEVKHSLGLGEKFRNSLPLWGQGSRSTIPNSFLCHMLPGWSRVFNKMCPQRELLFIARAAFLTLCCLLPIYILEGLTSRKFVVIFRTATNYQNMAHCFISLFLSLSCPLCPQRPCSYFSFPVSHFLNWWVNKHLSEGVWEPLELVTARRT